LVARLVGLGATATTTHEENGRMWIVMSDPEGYELCLPQA
jgi:hypothetical protein